MADRGVDLVTLALPKEVREQLAELELEVSEGKKRDGVFTQLNRHDVLREPFSQILRRCYVPVRGYADGCFLFCVGVLKLCEYHSTESVSNPI